MLNYPEHIKLSVYKDPRDLDKTIATELIEEFQKPGLIVLPSGNTFEGSIYKYLNDYYASNPTKLNPELRLTHLDELIIPGKSFFELETNPHSEDPRYSKAIKKAIPAIISQCGFFTIDPDDIRSFEIELKREGGPNHIYMGLGADPNIAHVALIGEAGYINADICKVPLSGFDVRGKYKFEGRTIKEAVTIGTDILGLARNITVIVKGSAKAASLKRGFEDPDTGLGYLIANYSDKLRIVCDGAVVN